MPQTSIPDTTMVLVHGATIQIGIEAAQIPTFERIFQIDHPELFQDEVPKHSVTLDDFYLDRYPVTNAQFKKFTDTNPDWQPGHIDRQLDNGNYLKHWRNPDVFSTGANNPVVNVNWYAAMAFCRGTGSRLPTEAEWVHAARGGRDTLFPWGNQLPDSTRANFSESHLATTSPVGKYPANGYGLFDMAGNVWHFLADEWKPYPPTAQKKSPDSMTLEGQAFLQVKTRRVIHGGSFDGAPVNLWIEYRDSHPPNGAQPFVGFRCAK